MLDDPATGDGTNAFVGVLVLVVMLGGAVPLFYLVRAVLGALL